MEEKNNEIIFNYSKQAKIFFLKHENIKSKFKNEIKRYVNGEKIDIKELEGYSRIYRLRIGQYRVIYGIVKESIVIINVMLARNRGDIYKKMRNKK